MIYSKDSIDFLNNFVEANGSIFFDYDFKEIMSGVRALDLYLLEKYQSSGNTSDLKNLFCNAKHDNLESGSFDQGFKGEWLSRCLIGRNVSVESGANIMAHGGISIGDNTQIGKNVQLITVGHGDHPEQRHCIKCAPIIIEENVTIHPNAIIVNSASDDQPIIIGKGSIIEAGALVTRSMEAGSVVQARDLGSVENFNYAACQESLSKLPRHDIYEDLKTGFKSKSILATPPLYVNDVNNASIGDNCIINLNSRLSLGGTMNFSSGSMMAPNVEIYIPQNSHLEVEPNVWLGASSKLYVPENTTLTIGEGSIIGSMALVTKDVDPMSLYVGYNRKLKDIPTELAHGSDKWLDKTYVVQAKELIEPLRRQITEALWDNQSIDPKFEYIRQNILAVQPLERHFDNLTTKIKEPTASLAG